jgi:hypothetical protein
VVTNDGITIAREIHLEDQFQNMGAQLVKEAGMAASCQRRSRRPPAASPGFPAGGP